MGPAGVVQGRKDSAHGQHVLVEDVSIVVIGIMYIVFVYMTSKLNLFKERVKVGDVVTSSIAQALGELIVQLGSNTAAPGAKHGVTETNVGPVVPANEGALVEVTEVVLDSGLVVAVGDAEAVGEGAILVVDDERAGAVQEDAVAARVLAVA